MYKIGQTWVLMLWKVIMWNVVLEIPVTPPSNDRKMKKEVR
jgi:hypothetical protein